MVQQQQTNIYKEARINALKKFSVGDSVCNRQTGQCYTIGEILDDMLVINDQFVNPIFVDKKIKC